jgi:hypothetical protein
MTDQNTLAARLINECDLEVQPGHTLLEDRLLVFSRHAQGLSHGPPV